MKDADTARPQTKTPVITSDLTAEANSFSISESTVTKAAPTTDDAIRQAMSINVNKADDQPGTVDVYVILSGKGAAISNTVKLTFTGPNDALSIGEPSDTLLAFTEVTTLPEVLRRDVISFELGALDAGGNAGPVPDVRVRILNPDGKVVNEDSIDVEQGPNSKKVPNAKLTLTSLNDALTPLDAGTYTVKITSAGGLTASGEVHGGRSRGWCRSLSVDTNAPSAVGEIITATATVTADGQKWFPTEPSSPSTRTMLLAMATASSWQSVAAPSSGQSVAYGHSEHSSQLALVALWFPPPRTGPPTFRSSPAPPVLSKPKQCLRKRPVWLA